MTSCPHWIKECVCLLVFLAVFLPITDSVAATITLNNGDCHTYVGCGNDSNCVNITGGTATINYGGGCNQCVISGATMTLNGNLVSNITGVRLRYNGTTDLAGGTRTITAMGAGITRFVGDITNGGLILDDQTTGCGHFYLSSDKTYTGGTTILGGCIKYTSSSPFGTGDVTIDGDTRLLTRSDNTIANNIIINAELTFFWNNNEGATITTGNITISSGGTLQNEDLHLNTSASDLYLNGGTLNTNNIAMTINSLTLSDNSTINLGTNEIFTIGDSRLLPWTAGKTLTINNWIGPPGGPSTGPRIAIADPLFFLPPRSSQKSSFSACRKVQPS